jgi:hypothetical protein
MNFIDMFNTLSEAYDEADYNYDFFFAGSKLDEDKFKQKLIMIIKSLKSISAAAAIPDAAEVIVSGLKEGAEVKGVSIFELGDKTFMVKAKKTPGNAQAEENI